eukprot:5235185-Amphidinium_carterae.1
MVADLLGPIARELAIGLAHQCYQACEGATCTIPVEDKTLGRPPHHKKKFLCQLTVTSCLRAVLVVNLLCCPSERGNPTHHFCRAAGNK